MDFKRICFLYTLYTKSVFRKIWYDLIREIVIGLCSIILIMLFVYMFQDFINVKLAAISAPIQERFGQGLSLLAGSLACLYLAKTFKYWRETNESIEKTSNRLGETPENTLVFVILKTLIFQAIIFIMFFTIIKRYIYTPSLMECFTGIGLLWVLSFGGFFVKPTPRKTKTYKSMTLKGKGLYGNLIRWRLHQMFLRNRLTKLCLFLALATSGLVGITGYADGSFPLAAILSLLAGYLLSATLIFQAQEDMKHSWIEKHSGISHKHFVNTYLLMAFLLGLVFSSANLLVYSAHAPQKVLYHLESWKLLAITCLPLFTFCGLIFQVDPKRGGIQLMTNFIISLFLGTAILAHWLSLVLVPVFLYYSLQYQQNAFYES